MIQIRENDLSNPIGCLVLGSGDSSNLIGWSLCMISVALLGRFRDPLLLLKFGDGERESLVSSVSDSALSLPKDAISVSMSKS